MNDLCERYIKQQKFVSFMVGARCLWENLVGGATQNQKKKKEVDVSALKIKEIDSAKKEKQRNEARKSLQLKLKQTEEDRK